MEENKIQLSYTCPKKWSELSPSNNGRYCGQCQKNVIDFTNKSSFEIEQKLVSGSEKSEVCGSFNAYQLTNPYNNWKDRIVSFYQKSRNKTKSLKFIRPFVLGVLAIALLLSGCRRRLMGVVAYDYAGDDHKKKPKTEKKEEKKAKF